jgi:hypothetical protein
MNAWLPQASSRIPASTRHFRLASTALPTRRTAFQLLGSVLSDGGSTYLKLEESVVPGDGERVYARVDARKYTTPPPHGHSHQPIPLRALNRGKGTLLQVLLPPRLRIDPTNGVVTRTRQSTLHARCYRARLVSIVSQVFPATRHVAIPATPCCWGGSD